MHTDVTSDQIGKYVFLPGSVERAALIAEHFDNPVKVAHKREFLTYTGTLEGVPVTVTSTGIGGPSACIAIEELHSCGAHTMMRIGSAASTSPKVRMGDVVIPNGAVRMEGTGKHYLPFEFPAVPDFAFAHDSGGRAFQRAEAARGYRLVACSCAEARGDGRALFEPRRRCGSRVGRGADGAEAAGLRAGTAAPRWFGPK